MPDSAFTPAQRSVLARPGALPTQRPPLPGSAHITQPLPVIPVEHSTEPARFDALRWLGGPAVLLLGLALAVVAVVAAQHPKGYAPPRPARTVTVTPTAPASHGAPSPHTSATP